MKCPRCGKEAKRLLALSRADNKTMICDECGTNRLDILDKAFVSRCSQKYEMPPFTVEESKQMVNKFLNDIEISIPDIEIDQIVQKNSDQRTIMADVIRLIADRLEVEDENS